MCVLSSIEVWVHLVMIPQNRGYRYQWSDCISNLFYIVPFSHRVPSILPFCPSCHCQGRPHCLVSCIQVMMSRGDTLLRCCVVFRVQTNVSERRTDAQRQMKKERLFNQMERNRIWPSPCKVSQVYSLSICLWHSVYNSVLSTGFLQWTLISSESYLYGNLPKKHVTH